MLVSVQLDEVNVISAGNVILRAPAVVILCAGNIDMFAVVVLPTVVVATDSVADVIDPDAATYWTPVVRVAIELLLLSRIEIDKLSVGFVLSGFDILVNIMIALNAGLTYDVQPSVIETVRVDTLIVVVMTRDGPNSPTPLIDVKSVVVIGRSDGNWMSMMQPASSGTGDGNVS